MPDITKTKYAEFLEDVCGLIMAYNPESIVVAYRCSDGGIGCSYHNCTQSDLLAMAGTMVVESTVAELKTNPERLRQLREALEGEE